MFLSMSGISQGMGRKNAEMGSGTRLQCPREGKSQKIVKSVFFFTPILGVDCKNVVFPRCVVKDVCVQLARYIQDSFCHYR